MSLLYDSTKVTFLVKDKLKAFQLLINFTCFIAKLEVIGKEYVNLNSHVFHEKGQYS